MKSFSRSPSPSPSRHDTQSVLSDNAIASRSALPTNSATSASQINPQSHQEAQSVTADNAIASISVLPTNTTTTPLNMFYGQSYNYYQPREQQFGPPGSDPQLWQYFTNVDSDRSGSIDVNELQSALVNGRAFKVI